MILHSRGDDLIPFADSEELERNSGATLIEVGTDHRLAESEPLAAMLRACEGAAKWHDPQKAKPADENLHGLQTSFRLAKEVEEGLGSGEVLLGGVQEYETVTETP